MNKLKSYMERKTRSTNIRVMIEICNDYNKYCKVIERKVDLYEFLNMTVQQRFNLLYEKIGVDWHKPDISDYIYLGFYVILVVGLICIGVLVIV